MASNLKTHLSIDTRRKRRPETVLREHNKRQLQTERRWRNVTGRDNGGECSRGSHYAGSGSLHGPRFHRVIPRVNT